MRLKPFRYADEETERNLNRMRRKQPKVFRNEKQLRQAILDWVRHNEGRAATKADILTDIGYQNTGTPRPRKMVEELCREGVIRKFKSEEDRGRQYRYFLAGSDKYREQVSHNKERFVQRSATKTPLLAEDLQENVLEFIRKNEGKALYKADIARALGYAPTTSSVFDALKRLIRSGRVKVQATHTSKQRYFVNETPQPAEAPSKTEEKDFPKGTAIESLLRFLENHTGSSTITEYLRWLMK